MTELLGKYSGRQRAGHQVQEIPSRILERHFPDDLGAPAQCKLQSMHVNVLSMAVKIVAMFIYVLLPVLGFNTLGHRYK